MMIKILALVAILATTVNALSVSSVTNANARGFTVNVEGLAGETLNVNLVTAPNTDFTYLARTIGTTTQFGDAATLPVTLSGTTGSVTFNNLIPDRYNVQVCRTTPPECSTTFTGADTLCYGGGNVTLWLGNTNTAVAPNLKIYFQENLQFTDIKYEFVKTGGTVCGNKVGSSPGTWTRTGEDLSDCDSPLMEYNVPINDALANCGFSLAAAGGTATYTATIKITTQSGGEVIRGIPYPTMVTSTVDIKLTFQTAVTAAIDGTPLQIIGDVLTLSTITDQTWDATNEQATLTLLTSVQWPYQINAPTIATPDGGNWNAPSITPKTPDSQIATAALCKDGSNAFSAGAACAQEWTIVIKRSTSCAPGVTLDLTQAGWTVTAADMICHELFTGGCDAADITDQSVVFDTASDNYCPNIFTGETASATLTPYKDDSYSILANDYVFGSNTYFEAVVTADAKMTRVFIEKIEIVAGGVSNNQVVYSYDVDFGVTGNDYGTWVPGIQGAARTEAVNEAGVIELRPRFTWEWDNVVSSASGDSAMPTTIQVTMQIQYLGGAGSKRIRLQQLIGDSNKDFGVKNAGATTARASVGVSSKSSSSSSTLGAANSMTALVVACALVGLLVFIVVARRRRRKEEDLEVQEEEQGDSVHLALPTKKVEESQA